MEGKMFNILLIEDNEGDVELTKRALRDQKDIFHVSVANDGLEGLNYLRQENEASDKPRPDLIFLDLNMPRMDGKAFLETVKGDINLKLIPVIMLTSSESENDIRECYDRHANSYIVKPFDTHEFADVIKKTVSFWRDIIRRP